MEHMFDAFVFDRSVQLKVIELAEGRFYDQKESQIGNPMLIVSKDHMQ